jgi:hypothetical protein
MNDLRDLFYSWTLMAMLAAAAGGIGLAVVVHWLHLCDRRSTVWIVSLAGIFWLTLQTARLAFDPAVTIDPWRQMGVVPLYLIFFVGSLWATLRLIEWRGER